MCRYISLIGVFVVTIYHLSVAEEYFENYYDEIDSNTDYPAARNAIRWNVQKWPNHVIPYTYTDDYTNAQRETVDRALDYFNEHTCLRFEKQNYTRDENNRNQRIVTFTSNGNRCGTRVGYQPIPATAHNVYLSPICLTIPGAVQHETMHVMGIFHEQCRSDRDQYIDIDWTNIDVKNYHNFVKVPVEYAKSFDIPYDYGSIMHYSQFAFSKDPRKPSMKLHKGKENPYSQLGQLIKPSPGDIQKIKRMYRCPNTT